MSQDHFNKVFVVLLLLFITALFLAMIRPFLMTIVMAAIFAALASPVHQRIARGVKGRRSLAAALTLFLIVFGVLIPLLILLGAVTAEAFKVSQTVKPWVQRQLAEPAAFSELLEKIPFYDRILPYKETILLKAGEMVGRVSTFLINSLSSVTLMTAQFLFMTFIFLYAMFFFLVDGRRMLERVLFYLPLKPEDEARMLDKFTSVTRATLKGVAVIGILQGGLAGLAFAAAGIPSPLFWGCIMVVLSMVPGIGTAIVWVPAAVILAGSGAYGKAIALAAFCGVVVGGVDNLLRPRLVGKDTRLHELMIFFGTLGGIFMFGVDGIILGPIVAALLVTVWEIYGAAFKDSLPPARPTPGAPSDEEERRILLADDAA
jgi:predicted PurR-regulated permease PerM